MSVFGDTQVQGASSSVTPQQAVADNSAADALSSTAELAGVGLGIMKQASKDKVDANFQSFSTGLGRVVQAFHQDPSKRTSLRAQGQKIFDDYVSGGGDAVEARKVWNAIVGSGGGGKAGAGLAQDYNLFAATPQEQSKNEMEIRVEQLVATTNMTHEDATHLAQEEVRMALAEKFQPKNEAEFASKYSMKMASFGTQFAVNIDSMVRDGGGSIDDKVRQNVLLSIDQQEQLVLADLALDSKPTSDKYYSPEFIRAESERIRNDFENMREMVKDNGTMEVLTRATKTASLRETQLAQKHFPEVRILNNAGGQAYVQSYVESLRYNKGSPLNVYWMNQIDPVARALSGNAEGQAEISTSVYGKAISDGQRLNPFESDMLGKVLMSLPRGNLLPEALVKRSGESSDVAADLGSVAFSDPQAAENIFSQENVKKLVNGVGNEGYKSALGGVKSRVSQSFIMETGQLPTDYINIRVDNRNRFYANMNSGSQAQVNNIKSLYKMLENNPEYVRQLEKNAGRDLSLEEALNFELGIEIPEVVDTTAQEKREEVSVLQTGQIPMTIKKKKESGAISTGERVQGLLESLETLKQDKEFLEKSSEEKLKDLEDMGYDSSTIFELFGNVFGDGPA